MRNQHAAVTRRLSDPDFQGRLVSRLIVVALATTTCLVIAIAHDAWAWSHPVEPRYFFVDGKTSPHPVVALDSPIVSDTELLQWTVQAVIAPYNVDYYNYAPELNAASRRFTADGWNTYAKSFIDQGNFEEIKRAHLLCHAQAQRAAVIHQTSYVQGSLSYQIQVPILQTCENVNQTSSSTLLVTAQVVRTNSDDHPDGLAIEQLVASNQH